MKRISKRSVSPAEEHEPIEQVEVIQQVSTEVQWINTGGKFYRADGRCVLPGQKFMANENEIPKAFRDVIKPLTPIIPIASAKIVSKQYHLRSYTEGENEGLFDIVDNNGKVLNEKPLDEDNAQIIMKALKA
jgi:hypothetical protein